MLGESLRRQKTSLRPRCSDQAWWRALATIYVCEALFARGCLERRASTIADASAGRTARPRLWSTPSRRCCTDAIKAGGSSLRDHRPRRRLARRFPDNFLVYDREGQPCPGGCQGQGQAHRADRPLHLLLPELPE